MENQNEVTEETARYCMEYHKSSIGVWDQGDVVNYYREQNGDVVVTYESGQYWHYVLNENGNMTGWY